MFIKNNGDGTWSIILNDMATDLAIPTPILTVQGGSVTPHQLWTQILAFCAANNVHLIPAMVAINASGTTGTILS